jgi:twitching motility protein PilT
MAKRGASSLHLSAGSLPTMRIDNHFLVLEGEDIITLETLEQIINSYLDDKEKEILEKEREIIVVKNIVQNYRYKVNVFYQKKLPSISFYYISSEIRTISQINIPQVFISQFLTAKSGLLVVAGPFCSGKSTTSASLIDEFNSSQDKRIITLEDPIEHVFISRKSIIEQRQIHLDVNSAIDGLEYCLQEDVDLVYLSENREVLESALPLAVEVASGNALIILEMNAQNTIAVIEKLLNHLEKTFSREACRHMLADVLFGIVVQRLVPLRGSGMIMAPEIVLANSAIKSLIRDNKLFQLESVIQTSRKEGMISMQKSLEDLVLRGEVRPEDIL